MAAVTAGRKPGTPPALPHWICHRPHHLTRAYKRELRQPLRLKPNQLRATRRGESHLRSDSRFWPDGLTRFLALPYSTGRSIGGHSFLCASRNNTKACSKFGIRADPMSARTDTSTCLTPTSLKRTWRVISGSSARSRTERISC